MKLYHGTHRPENWQPHLGLCLTTSRDAAEHYAGQVGAVHEWEYDLNGLIIMEVAEYDHDANNAVGDNGEYPEADILVYDDEDTWGEEHDTYRIVSHKALARVR